MFYKILQGVLLYAPIGVFGISATAFGGQGWETFESLLKFTLVFAANITGLELSAANLFSIVLIRTVLSIRIAGVPAAGLVTLVSIISMFNLPLEIVALIAGIDTIIGMGGTASNVMGDIIGATVVDKSENKQAVKYS